VLTSEQQTHKPKQSKIRYTEYYDLQSTFDRLYADSLKGKTFHNLIGLMASEENIKLAYRTIKGNKGSGTPGVDKRTIKHLASMEEEKFVRLIQKQFSWYNPRPVRRVEIPKPNGKTRPLGIPTIVDRIVQQCILQVLEPICEAKFHERSNGFRPNRSTEHAIAQCYRLMQIQHLHYAVDLDIHGFFDNVNHGKLIRQMWELGIRDKKLLCIIKQMLRAPIVLPDGKRIYPTKGTPQGGILSPLLSNIVLNELDWWVSSQWENMPTHYEYKTRQNARGTDIKSHTYRALRRSNLKEMYLVRYADDFKIFCRSYKDAVKTFEATKRWLKDRLGLDISPEKSKVINMEQRYSEFLGFKMKLYRKGKKYVVCSHMSDKAVAHAKEKISAAIKAIQTPADSQSQYIAIQQYNSVVAGLHNYYRLATRVSEDFPNLAQGLKKQMSNRLRGLTRNGKLERSFIKERYGKSKQLRFLNGHPLIPIGYVQTRDAQHKKKTVNRYTPEGRAEIHKNLGVNTDTMIWLMRTPVLDKSIEFADNRISLFAAQYGRCAITGTELMPYDIRCHHKVPLENGGTDKYSNLVLVTEAVHLLIHATLEETIQKYLKQLQLNKKQLEKLNKLRKLAGTPAIVMQTFPKQHFGGLCDLALRLSVHFKTGRTGKAKELRFLEMPNNILVHISELAAVAFVNDEDNLFVTVCVHYLFVLRTLNGICHLLHRRDNELPVLILHLPHKNVRAICDIHRASLKLVELFGGLRVQVLTVNKEDNLLDVRIGCEDLSCLKGCQRLSCTGGMPDIGVAICERSLPYKGFYGIHLIGAHNHQNLIRIVQNGIACQHLDDVIPCQKRD